MIVRGLSFALVSVTLAAGQVAPSERLWRAAWACAAQVESPIDAGRAQVALQALAVGHGLTNRVTWALAQGGETWVRGALCALAAASDRLNGDAGLAQARLAEAQRLAASENEWRRTLMARELAQAEAVAVLLSGPAGKPDVQALRAWQAADAESRTAAAAWACAEWVARSSSLASGAAGGDLAEAALDFMGRLPLRERSARLARMAGGLRACGLAARVQAVVDDCLGPGGAEAVPVERFDVLVNGARALASAGAGEKASGLFALARERLGRGQTGDEPAPHATFAAALKAAGLATAADRELGFDGLAHAARQPGYHRRVAAALAAGWISVEADAGSEAEHERARRLLAQASGLGS